MRIHSYSFHLILGCLLAVSLSACDQSSQNIDFDDGSNLTINGPDSLQIPNFDSTATNEFMVRAFTIEQDYSWSVEGVASLDGTRRDGEVAIVSSSTPGPLNVTVTTTIDGEEYTGDAPRSADYPTVAEQTAKYNQLNTFGSFLMDTGMSAPMGWDSPDSAINGWTAFAPSNEAFVNVLDADTTGADGEGEISEDEMPAPGILAKVLQYHVVTDSLTTSEIGTQSVSTLLHPDETLTLDGSMGTVEGTNQTASFGATDIATNDGVVHEVDAVLLPSSIVSFNDQTVARDTVNDVDSVSVEGTYVADGGFVALRMGDESGDLIGSSDFLDDGFHGNASSIPVELNEQISDSTAIDTTVVAIPHQDNGDETFNPTFDDPYTRGNTSEAVVDSATVTFPAE